MISRELLLKAAKVAGYNVHWSDRFRSLAYRQTINIYNPSSLEGLRNIRAPHINDGDAMRLAVKLEMFFQGIRRKNILKDGVRIGLYMLGITKGEWIACQPTVAPLTYLLSKVH